MGIDDRRKRWLKEALDEGCPSASAAGISKEKFYDELLAAAMDMAEEMDTVEDDLK